MPFVEEAVQVFLSYRRDDSGDLIGRIRDRLAAALGAPAIFTDIDSIPPGADFRQQITNAIARCDVVLVVIGPRWLTSADASGKPRLAHDDDFVRIEVESALARSVPVVPLLVLGAEMPRPEAVPESLRELTYRQALQVRRDPDFHPDMNRLLDQLGSSAPESHPAGAASMAPRRRKWGLLAAAAVVALAAAVLIWSARDGGIGWSSGITVTPTSSPPASLVPPNAERGPLEVCSPQSCEYLAATVAPFTYGGAGVVITEPTEPDLTAIQQSASSVEPDAFPPELQDRTTAAGVIGREITLSGTGPDRVVIHSVRARILARSGIAPGIHVSDPSEECGGDVFPIYVDMRLDEDPVTTVAYRATADGGSERLPDDWSISVTQDDVEVLVVEAFAFTTDVRFVLEFDYSVAGRTGTMRIDDEGQPLRVTGVSQQTLRYTYNSFAAPGLLRTPQFDGALGTCHGWPDEVLSDDDLSSTGP
jgi:hypothetical protein